MIKVETFRGFSKFTKSEIKDMIENFGDYICADNIPKWLFMAIWGSTSYKSITPKVKMIVMKILLDLYNGEVKKIIFERDHNRNIIGLKNLDIKNYI